MKQLPKLLLVLLATTVLFSCNTAKYTVTDGVYYNPEKDRQELEYAMGYKQPQYDVVDKTTDKSKIDDSHRPTNVYKEVDTIAYNENSSYAGNSGTVINNNYYGDYYDYDYDNDFRYTRRINNFYYPSTTTVTYYSSWSRYGGNGIYCNTYYYDPWYTGYYDPWYYDPYYGYSSYRYSYYYGYGGYYGYNNYNSCRNNYYYRNPCGGYYNSPCGGSNRGYYNNRNNNGGDYYNAGTRWSTDDRKDEGYGPRNTLYTRGTTPGNGAKRELPDRYEVRNNGRDEITPNGGIVNTVAVSNKEKPVSGSGAIANDTKVLPNREKTVVNKNETIVAKDNSGNGLNDKSDRTTKDLPETTNKNTYYTLMTSPNSNISNNGAADMKTTVVSGNTRTVTNRNTVNTKTLPTRDNTPVSSTTSTTTTSNRNNSEISYGNNGSRSDVRTSTTYRPNTTTSNTYRSGNSGSTTTSRSTVSPRTTPSRTEVNTRSTPSGSTYTPRSTPSRTVSPSSTPSRTVTPSSTPSRTNVSPSSTPTRSNSTYTPSRSSSSSSSSTRSSSSSSSRSSSSSSSSSSSKSSSGGTSRSLPKR